MEGGLAAIIPRLLSRQRGLFAANTTRNKQAPFCIIRIDHPQIWSGREKLQRSRFTRYTDQPVSLILSAAERVVSVRVNLPGSSSRLVSSLWHFTPSPASKTTLSLEEPRSIKLLTNKQQIFIDQQRQQDLTTLDWLTCEHLAVSSSFHYFFCINKHQKVNGWQKINTFVATLASHRLKQNRKTEVK